MIVTGDAPVTAHRLGDLLVAHQGELSPVATHRDDVALMLYSGGSTGRPKDAVAYYRGLTEAGLTYFVAGVYGNDTETIRLLAERVVPAVDRSGAGTAG